MLSQRRPICDTLAVPVGKISQSSATRRVRGAAQSGPPQFNERVMCRLGRGISPNDIWRNTHHAHTRAIDRVCAANDYLPECVCDAMAND